MPILMTVVICNYSYKMGLTINNNNKTRIAINNIILLKIQGDFKYVELFTWENTRHQTGQDWQCTKIAITVIWY